MPRTSIATEIHDTCITYAGGCCDRAAFVAVLREITAPLLLPTIADEEMKAVLAAKHLLALADDPALKQCARLCVFLLD